MRTIDADRLKRSFEANTPIAFQDCVPGIHSVIDLEPTVEAIPVEYIESTMNRWKEIIGYEESVDALRILIDNWKIERKEEC